ncbi:MAG: hypothetical protein PHO44_08205, partial [Sphaerochaetaceae bacterium]|nr:hypothetical protein [Sphaerochaetaceae bacterium]
NAEKLRIKGSYYEGNPVLLAKLSDFLPEDAAIQDPEFYDLGIIELAVLAYMLGDCYCSACSGFAQGDDCLRPLAGD